MKRLKRFTPYRTPVGTMLLMKDGDTLRPRFVVVDNGGQCMDKHTVESRNLATTLRDRRHKFTMACLHACPHFDLGRYRRDKIEEARRKALR